jgi:hypothetical protein
MSASGHEQKSPTIVVMSGLLLEADIPLPSAFNERLAQGQRGDISEASPSEPPEPGAGCDGKERPSLFA